jgi:hypothetical protein
VFIGECKKPEGHNNGEERDRDIRNEHSQLHSRAFCSERLQFENVNNTIINEKYANNPGDKVGGSFQEMTHLIRTIFGQGLHREMGPIFDADCSAEIGAKNHHIVGKFPKPCKRIGDSISEASLDKGKDCKAKKGHADKSFLSLVEFLYKVFHLKSSLFG